MFFATLIAPGFVDGMVRQYTTHSASNTKECLLSNNNNNSQQQQPRAKTLSTNANEWSEFRKTIQRKPNIYEYNERNILNTLPLICAGCVHKCGSLSNGMDGGWKSRRRNKKKIVFCTRILMRLKSSAENKPEVKIRFAFFLLMPRVGSVTFSMAM